MMLEQFVISSVSKLLIRGNIILRLSYSQGISAQLLKIYFIKDIESHF
jgi:hypothetical protein